MATAPLPLSFHKVVPADGFPVANGIYFVKDGQKLRMVVTQIDGSPLYLESPAPRFEATFTAAAQWTVNHNLGAKPAAVQLLTVGGVEFEASIVHTSDNQFVVSVSPPIAGQVIVQ